MMNTQGDVVSPSDRKFVVIGGGPAGLTAAYELTKLNAALTVLEKSHTVGGIARTENYKGYHFDMGGHRFFTKSKEVDNFWHEVLAEDFLRRPRLSRIYYKNSFFNYPLKPLNALLGLGPIESVRIGLSYIRWTLFPYKKEETFEQWVTNRFGKRLFEIFFKSYTEKVWGIPCSELRAEWAAQRIKDLSLKTAIVSMFFNQKDKVKTLIERFDYPRLGPGMLWRKVSDIIEDRGGDVLMESDVVRIRRDGTRVASIEYQRDGTTEHLEGTDFISSMPITEFIKKLDPPPPDDVLRAACELKYRDFLTVCLIVKKPDLFPDNWIYIHEPSVEVGRIQNFKNWSPQMVPDASTSSLGLEYFCNEGDELWTRPDKELIEQGSHELEKLGLAKYDDVVDGCVFRVPKSYPVYDADYRMYLDTIKGFLAELGNFQTIGRNGLHRYNNQDHAMLTGMLAVRNSMFGEDNNLWVVNADKEYHEEVRTDETPVPQDVLGEAMAATFAKLDRVAMGLSVGITLALALFAATSFLLLKGGANVGFHLDLLGQFYPGFDTSLTGLLIGVPYAFVTGFVLGFTFAFVRNAVVFLYAAVARASFERRLLQRLSHYF